MEEALYDVPLYREFASLDGGMARLPDESTILRFRHLLETHGLAAQMLALVNEILTEKGLMLKAGSAVDATLIAAPSSTKNGSGTRDPEMHSTQKGGNGYFGMKSHVRPESRLNFCLTQRGVHVAIKPVVPSTVPYPDMRSW